MYQACVLIMLFLGNETWSLYSGQDSMPSNCATYGGSCMVIAWQDRVTNTIFLDWEDTPNMLALLIEQCNRWHGHVRWMDDERRNDVLYGGPRHRF